MVLLLKIADPFRERGCLETVLGFPFVQNSVYTLAEEDRGVTVSTCPFREEVALKQWCGFPWVASLTGARFPSLICHSTQNVGLY